MQQQRVMHQLCKAANKQVAAHAAARSTLHMNFHVFGTSHSLPHTILPLPHSCTLPFNHLLQARVAHIVTGLGSYFGCLAYDRLTGTEDNTETVRRRAQQLRETLTDLGPSFIKAGQVLANRPDIVREDYMNELCILQVRMSCLHCCTAVYEEFGAVCAWPDPLAGLQVVVGSRV
jgi:hypothetical protein